MIRSHRILLPLLVFGCVITAAPVLGESRDDPRRARLDERLAAFTAAFQAGDADALEKMLAPHYTHTNDSSPPTEREDWLANIRRGRAAQGSTSARPTFSNSDVKVRVSGDTAVVTGLSTMRSTRDGKPFGLKIRFTNVWAWNGKDWFRVAFQDTYSPLEE